MDKIERINEIFRLINLYMKDYVELLEKFNNQKISGKEFSDIRKSLRNKYFDLISDLI